MEYPKEIFTINQDQTRRNRAEYERKKEKWYQAAEKLYPDYFSRSLAERHRLRKIINESVGFSI